MPLTPEQATTQQDGKQAAWRKLVDYILGYQATWVADIGLKSGLFDGIARGEERGIRDDQLADTLALHPHYVAIWCRAAFAYEMLDWDETSGYRLAPHMQSVLLDPTDPLFLGGRIQFNAALHQDLHAFPNYLPTGGTWPRERARPLAPRGPQEHDQARLRRHHRFRPSPGPIQ